MAPQPTGTAAADTETQTSACGCCEAWNRKQPQMHYIEMTLSVQVTSKHTLPDQNCCHINKGETFLTARFPVALLLQVQ